MTPEQMREHAKEAREAAKAMPEPVNKARLHEIADILERVAIDLEGDTDRRS